MNGGEENPEKQEENVFSSRSFYDLWAAEWKKISEGKKNFVILFHFASSHSRFTTTPSSLLFSIHVFCRRMCVCYLKIVFNNFIHKCEGWKWRGRNEREVRVFRARRVHFTYSCFGRLNTNLAVHKNSMSMILISRAYDERHFLPAMTQFS